MSLSMMRTKLLLGLAAKAVLFASFAAAQISTSPATLTYTTELYATSGTKYVFVTNTGAAAVSFGTATISGSTAGNFATAGDTCSNHAVSPAKKCKVGIEFSPTLPIGNTETAALSINDSLGNVLATIPLSGLVTGGTVRVSLSGLTVTILNPTTDQFGMDFSLGGPYDVDTTNTTCVDVVFPESKCQIVLVLTGSAGPGSLYIDMAAIGPGRSHQFNVPLD